MENQVKQRRFGRTELQMPVLTCGGMRFQYRWTDVEPRQVPADQQANLEAVVFRAFELGINHFETARGYGSSEMQLGRVLPQLPRDKIIVQTKVAPQSNPRKFRKIFDRSMNCLGLEHVDLLALHGINNRTLLDWSLRKGGCLEAARTLQNQGRVRFVGFSTHATTDIIHEAVESGGFDYVNLHWYFVNDLNWLALAAAAKRDMGVLIISPNDKGGKLYEPPPKLREWCAPLTPMQFNDLFCLARPEVHTLSIGAARPGDFDEHVRALDFYDRIEETIRPVEIRLRTEMNKALGPDWCRRWFEGVPEYVAVPGEINLREILRLWTYAKGLGLVEWGKMRYNLLGRGDHWFPGENAAKAGQYDLRSVLGGSPFSARIPAVIEEAHALLAGPAEQRLSRSLGRGVWGRIKRAYWRWR